MCVRDAARSRKASNLTRARSTVRARSRLVDRMNVPVRILSHACAYASRGTGNRGTPIEQRSIKVCPYIDESRSPACILLRSLMQLKELIET